MGRLKEKKEQFQLQAESIKKNRKSIANCRQRDRSKETGIVWHKEPEQQKVRAERAGAC